MQLLINVKKRSLNLVYCLVGGVLAILCLSQYSRKVSYSGNGFIRLIPPHVAIPDRIRDLRVNSYYLAGGSSSIFYLGNHTSPHLITTIDQGLADSSVHRLSMLSAGGRFARSLMIQIDSPHIYLFEGVTPTLVQGKLNDSLLRRTQGKFYFNLATPLSPVSAIFRVVDQHRQNILVKQLNDSITHADNILEKQVDGIFCTEGSLHAQPKANRLVYVYSYRNQFIVMDTNMQVRYKGRTIDTVSHVKFSVNFIPSEKSLTLSSPPTFVNKESCVSGNYVFIHSGLRADNDESSIYDIGSPIDVYSLVDGHYLLSFFLPDYQHHKIRDFRVFGNTLIALYDHYAYTYKLNIPVKLRQ
jgi:hypothetical protein